MPAHRFILLDPGDGLKLESGSGRNLIIRVTGGGTRGLGGDYINQISRGS